MRYDELPPAEIVRMRERTAPIAERFMAEHHPETVKTFRAELKRVGARN